MIFDFITKNVLPKIDERIQKYREKNILKSKSKDFKIIPFIFQDIVDHYAIQQVLSSMTEKVEKVEMENLLKNLKTINLTEDLAELEEKRLIFSQHEDCKAEIKDHSKPSTVLLQCTRERIRYLERNILRKHYLPKKERLITDLKDQPLFKDKVKLNEQKVDTIQKPKDKNVDNEEKDKNAAENDVTISVKKKKIMRMKKYNKNSTKFSQRTLRHCIELLQNKMEEQTKQQKAESKSPTAGSTTTTAGSTTTTGHEDGIDEWWNSSDDDDDSSTVPHKDIPTAPNSTPIASVSNVAATTVNSASVSNLTATIAAAAISTPGPTPVSNVATTAAIAAAIAARTASKSSTSK